MKPTFEHTHQAQVEQLDLFIENLEKHFKNKLFSLHTPGIDCTSKGRVHNLNPVRCR